MLQVKTLFVVAFLVVSCSVVSVKSAPSPQRELTTNSVLSDVTHEPALFKRMYNRKTKMEIGDRYKKTNPGVYTYEKLIGYDNKIEEVTENEICNPFLFDEQGIYIFFIVKKGDFTFFRFTSTEK